MDRQYVELVEFLSESLQKKGFEIRVSVINNKDELPVINGYSPDIVASYKGVKTVYGKVELPEDILTIEQWNRLDALSADSSTELYIAFPEESKMKLVLSLINGKLSERKNIIRLYK